MGLLSWLPEPFVTYAAAHPRQVPGLASRYLRMRRLPLLSQRSRNLPRGDRRVVITLTTLPSRIDRLKPVLNSLVDQDAYVDEIVLALPKVSRREKVGYPIPEFLRGTDAVTILDCDRDWGPATKLIPALLAEKDPDALVIALDDDNIYPPNMVSTLLAWHREFPDAALGYRGWAVPESLNFKDVKVLFATSIREPQHVDVVTGTWGMMVQPRFFDERLTDYTGFPAEAFFVDDIWFNGQLARRKVPRITVSATLPPLPTAAQWVNALGVVENADGAKDSKVLRAFAEHWNGRPAVPAKSSSHRRIVAEAAI